MLKVSVPVQIHTTSCIYGEGEPLWGAYAVCMGREVWRASDRSGITHPFKSEAAAIKAARHGVREWASKARP